MDANWRLDDALRTRQQLLIAPSETLLPDLPARLGAVDLFIHDSDHLYAHMTWELRTAFSYVRAGGCLWADDILTNAAWTDCCRAESVVHSEFISQGLARNTAAASA